ncbi:protein-tyrosine phosphatase [Aquimarina brevivitae]|uniref:protein-tyrosine-phosphatase n=2 Tax=Aquimarina brevivitae TaxID=323412 RepID=A0A4Q7NZG9_9FLAO|nr:protein-tyrosine phosphatase [Aquimarina brevivitae]
MVCLGNICRSPLAEGILQSKLDPTKFQVDSCGTASYHIGNTPDPRSIEVAKKNGIDISSQRADQFKVSYFDNYDRIYVMDESNYNNVIALAKNQQHINKVKLILQEIQPDSVLEVPDPYYGGADGFDNVYQLLDNACTTIATQLKQNSK